MRDKLDLWTCLEGSINDAASAAYMLARSVEERLGDDAEGIKDQREAIAYGAYRLEEMVKAVKGLFYDLLKETYHPHRNDDDTPRKVVSLH